MGRVSKTERMVMGMYVDGNRVDGCGEKGEQQGLW
jgi:hypothetical protein